MQNFKALPEESIRMRLLKFFLSPTPYTLQIIEEPKKFYVGKSPSLTFLKLKNMY